MITKYTSFINEKFFYRDIDVFDYFYNSMKNIFINLRYAAEQEYKMTFLYSQLKESMVKLKSHLLTNFKKENIKKLENIISLLKEDIDNSLLDVLHVEEFINDLVKYFQNKFNEC